MKITRRQLRKIIKEEIERPSAGFRDAIDAIGEEIANLGDFADIGLVIALG